MRAVTGTARKDRVDGALNFDDEDVTTVLVPDRRSAKAGADKKSELVVVSWGSM